MNRTADLVDRAHRSRRAAVVPSALLDAACAAAPRGLLVGPAARLIAPNLRGRVSRRTLAAMESAGLRVHRVGAAAYAHDAGGVHWILAVWDRGEAPPPFSGRLGRVSEGYRRRCDRLAREGRHAELARIAGRFAGRLPWWLVPPVRPYRWDPEPLAWAEAARRRAAERNRRARVARGLEWPDNRLGSWYPAAAGALEARSLDGDR